MKHTAVLTAVGRDRPGIVAAVSRILFQEGCNIEDSSMTILCGEFAMILIISIPARRRIKKLEASLKGAADRLKLFIALKEIRLKTGRRATRSGRTFIISVLGSDQPGIVYRVSRLLASHRVNITDLDTKLIGTDKTPVYAMLIEVQAPARLSLAKLRTGLNKLAKRMNVDIRINPLESVEL